MSHTVAINISKSVIRAVEAHTDFDLTLILEPASLV